MKKLLCAAGAATAAALAGGYWGFQYACKRIPEPDWEDEQALKSTAYAEFAESLPVAARWLRDHQAEDVSVTSFDGLTLRGKWVRAEQPKATVIFFHGYHTHYIHDFAGIFSLYRAMGLNLLLVRQRAHGESDGKYITFGVRERRDALRWIEFHNRTHGMDNVFLEGMSMGASTVLFAAGETLPPNVRGIVADCGFSSPAEILGHVIRKDFHLPPKLVLPLMNIWSKALAGFDLWECDTRQTLARAQVPVLLIHGKADTFVPTHMSRVGFDACRSPRELIEVEGAGHGRSFQYEPERITKALADFFTRNLDPKYTQEVHP